MEKLLALSVPLHWEPPPGDHEHWSCDVLVGALESGVPEILRMILMRHPDVNRADEIGDTPLTYLVGRASAGRGNADQDLIACAELLLASGADPYARDAKDRTVLDVAISGKSPAVPVLQHWMEAHPHSR